MHFKIIHEIYLNFSFHERWCGVAEPSLPEVMKTQVINLDENNEEENGVMNKKKNNNDFPHISLLCF